jgi:putative inorganic carbon (HCO3(-)) transporter
MTAGGITMIGATVALAMALWLKDMRLRLIFAVSTVFILGCLLLTATRGSWLGFLAAALLLIWYSNRKLLLIVPIVAAAFYLLQPEQFAPRIRHMFDPTWGTNAKRLHWWSIGYEIFKDHPIVGIGDVGTTPMYTRYAPPGETELVGHFHSNYVHIAVTLGGLGLAAFLFMMAAVFVRLWQQVRRFVGEHSWTAAWALAGLAAFLAFNINGFFEWNFGDQEIITMIWFCAGLGLVRKTNSTRVP